MIIFIGLYYYKKSKKRTNKDAIEVEKTIENKTANEEVKQLPKLQRNFRTSHNFSRKCIHLLGDFMVKDKNGDDISNQFTPTLKSLLTMLILYTAENPEGISGDIILQTLWSDKNKYAGRNNRNVSLTKLRGLLGKVGDVAIVNQGNYWKIIFGEDVLCDYSEIMDYYQEIRENRLTDKPHLAFILKLLYRGTLLHHTEPAWQNHYKGRFLHQTAEFLISLLNDSNITNDELRIKIADTLLQHDYINEEALRIQCILLHDSGSFEQMRSCYDRFCTNYSNLLGIQYNKTLRGILMGK